MQKINYKDTTLLLLRVFIVIIFIYHGLPKLLNPVGTSGFFISLGLPGFTASVVGIIEVCAGVLLLLGLWSKWANYALAIVIAGAIILVQIPSAIKAGQLTATFERDFLILISVLILAAHGPGHFAIHRHKYG